MHIQHGRLAVGKPRVVRRFRKLRSLMRRGRELGPGGLWLLVRTFWLLLVAKLALKWVPVSRIILWKQMPVRRRAEELPAALEREQLKRTRHAVLVVARYSPVRFVCFPQCLAAHALLRRQGIETLLHYGAARAGDKLVTHTWLEAGGEVVIGGEVAAEYSTLAVY